MGLSCRGRRGRIASPSWHEQQREGHELCIGGGLEVLAPIQALGSVHSSCHRVIRLGSLVRALAYTFACLAAVHLGTHTGFAVGSRLLLVERIDACSCWRTVPRVRLHGRSGTWSLISYGIHIRVLIHRAAMISSHDFDRMNHPNQLLLVDVLVLCLRWSRNRLFRTIPVAAVVAACSAIIAGHVITSPLVILQYMLVKGFGLFVSLDPAKYARATKNRKHFTHNSGSGLI